MRQDRYTVSGQETGPELLVAQCLCHRRQLPRNSAAILPDCRIVLRSEGLVLRSRWSNVYGRGSVDGSLVAKRCIHKVSVLRFLALSQRPGPQSFENSFKLRQDYNGFAISTRRHPPLGPNPIPGLLWVQQCLLSRKVQTLSPPSASRINSRRKVRLRVRFRFNRDHDRHQPHPRAREYRCRLLSRASRSNNASATSTSGATSQLVWEV